MTEDTDAMIMDGTPTLYIFPIIFPFGLNISFRRMVSSRLNFRLKNTANAAAQNWPMTVAIAAPRTPIAGQPR